MEQSAHSAGVFNDCDEANDDRGKMLESIAAFLVTNNLAVTQSNLLAAHAVVSESDPVFARRVTERQTLGHPITPEWLENAHSDQGSSSDRASDKINRLIDELETIMASFAQTAEIARLRTKQSRAEVAKHSSSYDTAPTPDQGLMLEVSQAMLRTLQTIQLNIEESQVGTAQLLNNLEQARREADTDPLTDLPNRRTFERTYMRMQNEAKAEGSNLFVAMCDVDHFKRINDDFGHQTGDNLLRAIAATLCEHISPVGFVARYGGEEFVLLLNSVDRHAVVKHIDAAREALAARKFVARRQGRSIGQVSFSAGIAEFTPVVDGAEALASADAMLYRAKDEGRNRVVAAWDVG